MGGQRFEKFHEYPLSGIDGGIDGGIGIVTRCCWYCVIICSVSIVWSSADYAGYTGAVDYKTDRGQREGEIMLTPSLLGGGAIGCRLSLLQEQTIGKKNSLGG